nr:zinc-binding dehydrogenase [Gluconobacter cerinus]
MFALLAGAHVTAISSSDEKISRLQEMGAHSTLNYRDTPKWGDSIARQGGADHVIEVGGSGTLSNSMTACRYGGAIHLMGALSEGDADPVNIMRRNLVLEGVTVGSRAMFESMNEAIDLHQMQPVIDRVFPFSQAREAYQYFVSARDMGKVVIDIS